MDGQEYLNQISASNRPNKKSSNGIFSSKIFMGSVIGVGVLILIGIVVLLLGSGKGGEKDLSFALKLHLDNTSSIITEYQPRVKSSILRSSSSSLYTVLSNTNRELTEYITNKFKFKEKDIKKDILEEATTSKDGLNSELFEARINGNLDRIFAHKMAYEISMFMNEESKILKKTNNDKYKEILTQSYNSLENLYSDFDDFSETK